MMENESVVNNYQILFTRIICSMSVVCMQVEMPPQRDPEVTMQDNMTRMTEAVVGLTQLVTQQVNVDAAQAQAQRMVAGNHRGSARADFRGQGSSGKSRKFRK